MALPDMSNSMYVARLRHIQSIHESSAHRNPDSLVGQFLPFLQRVGDSLIRKNELARLRSDPFYYYLVARTLYYDQVVVDAITAGTRRLVIVGSGSDTRPYRFRELLRSHDVSVLECDQAGSIEAKRRLALRSGPNDHVEYLAIDLNDGEWPHFDAWLGSEADVPTLILIEGVSPYVDSSAFEKFLRLLANRLTAGSMVAYDFKIGGVRDDFGRNESIESPFRMPADREEVTRFHETIGFHLEAMELSAELHSHLLPSGGASLPLFEEDGLLKLRVRGRQTVPPR